MRAPNVSLSIALSTLGLGLALAGCPAEVRSTPNMVAGFEKARAAFGEYAAGTLGVKASKVSVGPTSEAVADNLQLPTESGTVGGKVGRAWAFEARAPEKPGPPVRGWATPDGAAIALKQNLGTLFEEAGFWRGTKVDANEMASRLLWSMGMGSTLAPGRAAPSLTKSGEAGSLTFFRAYSPAGGGNASFVFECTVTLAADHKATFASSDNLNK